MAGQPAPKDGPDGGMPGWVVVSMIVAAIVIGIVVVAKLMGGGEHGPGRHMGLEERVLVGLPRRP